MNITFILWLKNKKSKMKDKGPYGGVGGGSAGVCTSLQWQITLLILPLGHQVGLWVCAAAASPQVRCDVLRAIPQPELFPGEGSSWE